jgi:hypothetical protein
MAFQSSLEGRALAPNHLLNADARHAGARGLAVRYVKSHIVFILNTTSFSCYYNSK